MQAGELAGISIAARGNCQIVVSSMNGCCWHYELAELVFGRLAFTQILAVELDNQSCAGRRVRKEVR